MPLSKVSPTAAFSALADLFATHGPVGAPVSERTLATLLDSIPTSIWIAASNQAFIFVNRALLEFTGRKVDEELDAGWRARLHPDDLALRIKEYADAAEQARLFTIEYRLRRADGQYRWVRDRGTPLVLQDGTHVGYIGTLVDITEAQESEDARRILADRFLQAQESERTRIARELHDDIGQRLAILSIQMQRAGKPVSGLPGQAHPDLPDLSAKAKEIASRVASLSHQLHSSVLEYLGLKAAVESCCREFVEQRKLKVVCTCTNIPGSIVEAVGLSVVRVVQEALNNVQKHSGATEVRVHLTGVENALLLEISDNGHGFDVQQARLAAGLGLISMRERVNLVRGTMEIVSVPGKGTRITARVPLTQKQ
jgi:PAS domain S-box-containing protein